MANLCYIHQGSLVKTNNLRSLTVSIRSQNTFIQYWPFLLKFISTDFLALDLVYE